MIGWPIVLLGALMFRDTSATPKLDVRSVELRALFCSTASGWHAITHAACKTRNVAKGVTASARLQDVARESNWFVVHGDTPRMLLHAQRIAPLDLRAENSNPLRYRITTPAASIPRFTDGAHEFERWTGPVVYRPLAVVTRDDVRDPEGWHASTLTEQESDAFAHAFRRRVTLPSCEIVPRDAPETARRNYTDREVRTPGVYRATSGALLVGLVIDSLAHPCDDVRDPSRTVHWFVGTNTTAPRFIGDEMQLLEIADFDGDGQSEWLFSVARYNEDGFLLCIDSCRRTRTTTWHYH